MKIFKELVLFALVVLMAFGGLVTTIYGIDKANWILSAFGCVGIWGAWRILFILSVSKVK